MELVCGLRVVKAEPDPAGVVRRQVHRVEGAALPRVLAQVVDDVWPEDEAGTLLDQDQLDLSFCPRLRVAGILQNRLTR